MSSKSRKKLSELIAEINNTSFEVASEVIAEDIEKIGLKVFIKHLLYYVPIDIVAKAVIEAEKEIKGEHK